MQFLDKGRKQETLVVGGEDRGVSDGVRKSVKRLFFFS